MLALVLFLGLHWIGVKDAYRVHRVYVNHYGNVIGDYYQPKPPSFQPHETPQAFTAQCADGKPVDFAAESEAKTYIEHCPVW